MLAHSVGTTQAPRLLSSPLPRPRIRVLRNFEIFNFISVSISLPSTHCSVHVIFPRLYYLSRYGYRYILVLYFPLPLGAYYFCITTRIRDRQFSFKWASRILSASALLFFLFHPHFAVDRRTLVKRGGSVGFIFTR